jgi:hypothetical protein
MSTLVNPNIGAQIRPSYHAVLILQIDRKCSRYNMVKDTCLIALKRKDRSPCILHLEILIELLLKVFVRRLWNNSLNAQAYNHINATIISIGTD